MTALLVACAAMNACIAGVDSYRDSFDRANAAYDAGDFQTAIGQYEQLVAEGVVNPSVFYNLGNAYYRAGQPGCAIANYERVLQLEPGHDHARQNLEKAVRDSQQHLARPLPPEWEQSVLFWHYGIGRGLTFVLAAVLWVGLWGLLSLRLWRPVPYTRALVPVLAVAAVAFGASAWAKAHPSPLAVANVNPTPVRYGTNETETVRFNLFPGDRVTVDKRMNGWSRVMTADKERGWTQDANLVFVGPPYEAPNPVEPKQGEAPKAK